MSDIRADYVGDHLDDLVVTDVALVHFEAMSANTWWIGITTTDGREIHINCGAVNPKAKSWAVTDYEPPSTDSVTPGKDGPR